MPHPWAAQAELEAIHTGTQLIGRSGDRRLPGENALAAVQGYVAGLESYNHECQLLIAQHLQGL